MRKSVDNNSNTTIGHSGNSDVDLVVNIDISTKAIAYGLLCSLYAKGELDETQLDQAIRKLDSLIDKDKKKQQSQENTEENKPKLYDFPQRNPRRGWF